MTLHPVVRKFATGLDDKRPTSEVIDTAGRITAAALQCTSAPEFSLDDDGSLSIDLRLSNGLRMLAELPIDGTLDVGVYDDRNPYQQAIETAYLSSATAEDLINLL